MAEQQTLHLVAGVRPDGELIYEQVLGETIGDDCFRLLTSPVFAKGAAKGDVIRMLQAGTFEIEQHGGNINVRVMGKDDIDIIRGRLNAALNSIEHSLDFSNERSLVYSIPVTVGFKVIDQTFNQALQGQQNAIWLYANVYDLLDGQTPLNWWHDFLAK